ncbi:MAG: glycosyltransferase family 4 protein [Thermoanaerobaculia bacterium]
MAPLDSTIHEIVHVSAGMNENGGGTAHLARMSGRALRGYCARHGLAFSGLHLPASDGGVTLDGYLSFDGSQRRFAAALLSRAAFGPQRRALFVDHLGPSRPLGLLPAALRPAYAVQLHGIEIWRGLTASRRRALARARFLVANSRTTAERSRPVLPEATPIRVVPLGIERGSAGNSESAGDPGVLAAAGEGFALIVGRLAADERYKGHDELLSAWPGLLRRYAAARLVIAGTGDDLDRLRARASQLGVQRAVYFAGRVDPATLATLYRRAALFAMPSREEGFGLVFVEAMAAGKPCIALAGTAPAEIVRDGETGLLVSADPAEIERSLIDALAALLGDPERAQSLGAAGRRRYEAEYTAEAFERRFEPAIDALVAGVSDEGGATAGRAD